MNQAVHHFDLFQKRDAEECRALWCAVILSALRDLCGSDPHAQREVESWVGPFASRDFKQVCALAGIEWGPVYARFSYLTGFSRKERKALYAKGLVEGGGLIGDASTDSMLKHTFIGDRISGQTLRQKERQSLAFHRPRTQPRPQNGKVVGIVAGTGAQAPEPEAKENYPKQQGGQEILAHKPRDQQQRYQHQSAHRPDFSTQKQARPCDGVIKNNCVGGQCGIS